MKCPDCNNELENLGKGFFVCRICENKWTKPSKSPYVSLHNAIEKPLYELFKAYNVLPRDRASIIDDIVKACLEDRKKWLEGKLLYHTKIKRIEETPCQAQTRYAKNSKIKELIKDLKPK